MKMAVMKDQDGGCPSVNRLCLLRKPTDSCVAHHIDGYLG